MKYFAYSLILTLFLYSIKKVESLIELCLDHHVLPHIDFATKKLILRGDSVSCSQCFMNLRNPRRIHNYRMMKTSEKKADELELSMHVSMKIDEFLGNQEKDVITFSLAIGKQ